jgi:hypothetical protein
LGLPGQLVDFEEIQLQVYKEVAKRRKVECKYSAGTSLNQTAVVCFAYFIVRPDPKERAVVQTAIQQQTVHDVPVDVAPRSK